MELIFIITLQDKELDRETASACLAVTIRGTLWKTRPRASNSRLCHASRAQSLEPSPGLLSPYLMVSCHLDSVKSPTANGGREPLTFSLLAFPQWHVGQQALAIHESRVPAVRREGAEPPGVTSCPQQAEGTFSPHFSFSTEVELWNRKAHQFC